MVTVRNHTKKNVGIVFGGESAEHEVSVLSALSVLEAMNKDEFEPHLIGVDESGSWHLVDEGGMSDEKISRRKAIEKNSRGRLHISSDNSGLSFTHHDLSIPKFDILFLVMHGPKGEDGSLQGLLELMGIPYVGPGVLSSAIGMDKDISKRLLREAGIPVADYAVLRKHDDHMQMAESVAASFSYPLFVKPANLGSSIGISKVRNNTELLQAITDSFRHDRKVVIEKTIVGDEIECAVLGNADPKVSVPGRVIFTNDFYDYEAKYGDNKGTRLEIPAQLSDTLQTKIQDTARRAYQALECEGLARVDMFVTIDGDVYVNEVNTLPGFTKYSMYPKLWEASGLPYSELITKLINHALDR